MYKKLVSLTVVLVVLALIVGALARPPAARAQLPTITVSGNKLMAGNQEIILRGVNLLDPLKQNRYIGHFEESYYAQAASWGAKVVRLPIHPPEWYGRWYDGTGNCTPPLVSGGCRDEKVVVEQAITWAANHGMYTIIDWHVIGSLVTGYFQSTTYKTTQAETESFWTYIATTYKDDPRVAAYELFNEPVTSRDGWQVSESDWIAQRDWYEGLIDKIRAIDPNKPVICNGLDWGYNLQYAGAHPVRRPNVIYGTHPYPNQDLPWNNYFGYLKATYPVLVTEFGFENGDRLYAESNYGGTGVYRYDLDAYLEGLGIGWMPWSFGPEWTPKLLADWNYTPTESGAFYRERLLAASGGSTPTPTPSANPTPTPVPTATPSSGTMHVSNIVLSQKPASGGRYSIEAVVTIVDANNSPVSGATVSGSFSGPWSGNVNGTTDSNGNATLNSPNTKTKGTWQFCVTDVVKSGWVYNSAANIETCDSITVQ